MGYWTNFVIVGCYGVRGFNEKLHDALVKRAREQGSEGEDLEYELEKADLSCFHEANSGGVTTYGLAVKSCDFAEIVIECFRKYKWESQAYLMVRDDDYEALYKAKVDRAYRDGPRESWKEAWNPSYARKMRRKRRLDEIDRRRIFVHGYPSSDDRSGPTELVPIDPKGCGHGTSINGKCIFCHSMIATND